MSGQRELAMSTSMLVAATQALPCRRGDQVGAERRLARTCLKSCGSAGARLLRCIDSPLGRGALALAEWIALPGICAHYRWRKRHIARWAHAEVAAGATQVLVLGAGFDGLSLSLRGRYPYLTAFEVDRARAMDVKRAALAQLGLDTARLALLACDIGEMSLADVLRGDSGFDPTARTVIIAEGLLMYLERETVAALCRELAATLASPPVLLFTLMQLDRDGSPAFASQSRLVRGWLARRGEPFRWGSTPERLHDELQALGVSQVEIAAATHATDPDPCPGEWVVRGVLRQP